MGMAVDAGKNQVIGTQVAIRAGKAGVFPRFDGEPVVENRLVPGGVGVEMAILAGGGIAGLLVVGFGGCIIILFMASITIAGQVVA